MKSDAPKKYLPVTDEPGQLGWVPVHKLYIDHANYQRPLSHNKVEAIAKNWNWKRVEVLSVALREEDNEYWVFEGQHRLAAAKLRGDIEKLPCIIFLESSSSQEAADFLGINRSRKRLDAVDEFKTLMAQSDPLAQKVADLLATTGHRIAKGKGVYNVQCARGVLDIARRDFVALQNIWPLVTSATSILGEQVSLELLRPIWLTQRALVAPQTLGNNYWSKRVTDRGLITRIRTTVRYIGGNAPVSMVVRAVVGEFNSGLRSNKLIIDELKEKTLDKEK